MKIGLIGSLGFGTHTGARTRAIHVYSLLAAHHDVTFLNVNTVNESQYPRRSAVVTSHYGPTGCPIPAAN
jgi:hypothetical protein